MPAGVAHTRSKRAVKLVLQNEPHLVVLQEGRLCHPNRHRELPLLVEAVLDVVAEVSKWFTVREGGFLMALRRG